jgi:histidinol-phosphate aminotransferase
MTKLRFNPNILGVPEYKGGLRPSDLRSNGEVTTFHKLSSNESPFGPSPKVVKAIGEYAGSLNRYPPLTDERLRQALALAYGRSTTSANFLSGNGAFEVLDMIARGFLGPNDSCIVCKPTFGVYMKTAMYQGAKIVDIPLDGIDFTHDVGAILDAVDESTRVVYICNPNNPAGSILTDREMARLVAGMPDHTVIVADEVYHHFVERLDFPDSLPYVLAGKNVIIVRSFSKAYGLAGLRVGYAISTPEIVGYLTRLRRTFQISTVAIEGAVAALQDQDHVVGTVDMIRAERKWLIDHLDQLNLKAWPSETNFVMLRCPVPAQQVFEHLLGFGVIVRPGSTFGMPDCIRVTIGVREANEALVAALSNLVGSRNRVDEFDAEREQTE